MSEKIQLRIDQISAASSVEMMIKDRIGKCQYSVSLVQPYRLVFERHGNEIQIAHIMEIIDYH